MIGAIGLTAFAALFWLVIGMVVAIYGYIGYASVREAIG